MKGNAIAVSLLTVGLLVSPLANGTNGNLMMSVGSQNTALGGSGVANFAGAESTFANPAMLAMSKGMEVTGGLVLFMPKVTNTGFTVTTPADSTADTNYIPDISFSSRISDNLTYGVAMAGIAGMGVDYTGASPLYVKGKTTMSLLKVVPTIAYNRDGYGVGFSPVLQYGSLAISYDASPFGSINHNPSHDADTDTSFGYSIGGYYSIHPGLTVAGAFHSQILMNYGRQLSGAGVGFVQTFADDLAQPAEWKAGVAYTFANSYTLTADYKLIKWADAPGFKAFGWDDQTVIAVGGKYAADGYWLGVGYNNADNPIKEYANGAITPAGNNGGVVNMFNNLLFPAIIENSFTFGGGYAISNNLAIEGAVMIASEVTSRVDISDAAGAPPGSVFNTSTHSQQSYAVSLRYKF